MFTTPRERRLWILALLVLAAIYSTAGLAPSLAWELRDRDLLGTLFVVGFGMIVVSVVVLALRLRPGLAQVGVALGVGAVYLMALARIGIPEERTHLVEYSVLAALIYAALLERRTHGRNVPAAAVITVVAVALLGWIDEGIQAIVPSRVYDLRDVGFNAGAGLMAVVASAGIAWARRLGRSGAQE